MVTDIYREEVLDHARNPRNRRKLSQPTAVAQVSNPLCGDTLSLAVVLGGNPPRVREVGFEAEACVISVAAASMLTEKIKGQTEADLAGLTEKEIFSWLGGALTPSRVECALLPLKALREVLKEANLK